MALVLKDRVKESTVSTGTGSITLDGATGPFQTFSVVGDGNTTYYAIVGQTTSEWEVGIGTYTASGTTLSRDTILASSASGAAVNFSAGTKDVFCTYPSEKGVWVDGSDDSNYAATIGTTPVKLGATTTTLAGLESVTLTQNPVSELQVATKQYVDNLVAAGIHFHAPVRVESPINLNATYNNGTAGVGATLTNAGTQVALVIDGITVNVADRVLVYQQTTQTQNGVYVVTNVGSGSTNWILTRADDADSYVIDSPTGLSEGSTFFVQQGDTGAGETYTCNTTGTITFGTTNITFAQISSAQIYSAGTGLTLTNTTFSLSNTAVTPASYGSASKTLTATVNAQGQLTALADTDIAIQMSQVTSGVLPVTQGGTGFSSYSVGDLIYADTTTSFAKLAGVATGNVLLSGGLGAAPLYGKVDLTTAVSGTLPVANGGTGVTTSTGSGNVVLSTSPTLVTPILGTPQSGNFSTGTFTWPTFNQNTTGTAGNVSGVVAIANGGTGETTRQAAMDALAGATTSGQYLRGNGSDVVMANIVAGDVPTLNQNTTGSAATLTTGRTIAITGDLTYTSGSFNGSANVTGTGTLANSGVTAGTYGGNNSIPSFTVDAKGRVTSATTVTPSGTYNISISGNAATATTATNQSGGTVNATTGAFSGQVSGRTGGVDATASFSATTTGGAYATMYTRRGGPFTSNVAQTGSSYAPTVSMVYNHNSGWQGVYSLGILNEAAASPGSFNITHINSSGGQQYAWNFQGSTGNFTAPGSIAGTNITAGGNVTGSSASVGGVVVDRIVYGDGARGKSVSRTNGTANNLTDPSGFYYGSNVTGMPTTDWWNWIDCIGDAWGAPDGYGYQLTASFWSDDFRMRRLQTGNWQSWVQLIHSGNIGSQNVNFANSSSVAGAAGTASQLTIARTINGTSFDGTANITTINWGTARNIWGQIISGGSNITGPVQPAAASASAPAFSTSGDTNTGMFFPAGDAIAWSTGATERMRIDPNGDFFIGKTAVNYRGNGIQSELTGRIFGVTNNIANPNLFCSKEGATGDLIQFFYNGTSRGYISTNGSTTSYVTTSDYRLKENIQPMTGALAKVSALKPVTYTWKEGGSASEGFIAHELAEVVPDAVTGEKDAVDEKGNIKPQGIDTSFLVATLTAAIQELKAELDVVKAELNTLKGN